MKQVYLRQTVTDQPILPMQSYSNHFLPILLALIHHLVPETMQDLLYRQHNRRYQTAQQVRLPLLFSPSSSQHCCWTESNSVRDTCNMSLSPGRKRQDGMVFHAGSCNQV